MADSYRVEAVSGAVYLPGERPGDGLPSIVPYLHMTLCGCTSLVKRDLVQELDGFDERLEGFGEDYELGIRLRQAGAGLLFAPGRPVLHLQAPSGGWRAERKHPWHEAPLPPRPYPILLSSRWKHLPENMKNGYALRDWIHQLRQVPLRRWILEAPRLAAQWKEAVRWVAWIETQPAPASQQRARSA